MVVEFPFARIIGGLPGLQVGNLKISQPLEALIYPPQHRPQFIAEEIIGCRLAHSKRTQLISVIAVRLLSIYQARLPERDLQFFQDVIALRF